MPDQNLFGSSISQDFTAGPATLGDTTIIPCIVPSGANYLNGAATLVSFAAALGVPRVFNVRHYGAVGDGVADDTTSIQNTINALATSGGVVFFPPGIYKLTTSLTLGNASATNKSTRNGIQLIGSGLGPDNVHMTMGAAPIAASRLVWAGGAAGVMIEIDGPIEGVRIEDLCLDCAGIAATGINSVRSFVQVVRNVQIIRWASGYALRASADSVYSGLDGGGAAPRQHIYDNLVCVDPAGASSHCVQLSSNVNGQFNCNQFSFIRCLFDRGDHDNAIGLWLGNIDHAAFINCFFGRNGSTAGKGIVVAPQAGATSWPVNIAFINTPIIGGVFHDTTAGTWSNTTHPALTFYPFYTADSQQVPPIGANSTTVPHLMVSGVTDQGVALGTRGEVSLIANSAAIANTTTETTFSKTITVRKEDINRVGARLRVSAAGVYSVTGTPTLEFLLRGGGTYLFNASMATDGSAANFGWSLTADFVVRTTGATASVQKGFAHFGTGSFSITGETPTGGGQVTLDLTSDLVLSINVIWGTASASNTTTLQHFTAGVVQTEAIS